MNITKGIVGRGAQNWNASLWALVISDVIDEFLVLASTAAAAVHQM